jgi:hypothetical protein
MRTSLTRHTFSVVLAGLVLLLGPAMRAEEESARDLFRRVVESTPKVPFTARMKLTNQRSAREFEMSHKQLSETTYGGFLRVTDPLDVKDTKFLLIEHTDGPDEQYIYIPSIRKVTRVGTNTREQQFLGSEFYVSDLVLPDPNSLDLSYVGAETVNGRACKLVNMTPRPGANWSYKSARYAIDPVDLLVVRTELSDEKGPFKVWTLDKVEKIDGIWTPLLQTMKNVRENVTSKLEIVEIRYRVDLPDNLFRLSRLQQER